MKLAACHKRLDVDEMLDELSCEQYQEWMAFDYLEGLGLNRLERMLSRFFAAVTSAFSDDEVSPDAFIEQPFTPDEEDEFDGSNSSSAIANYEYEVKAQRQIQQVFALVSQHNSTSK